MAVLDGLVALWDVDAGSIFLADEDGLTLRRVAYTADSGARVQTPPKNLALGEGAWAELRSSAARRCCTDPGEGGAGGMIVAPMLASGRLVGVIGLATRPSRPTGRQELLLLQAFAARLGGGDPGRRRAGDAARLDAGAATASAPRGRRRPGALLRLARLGARWLRPAAPATTQANRRWAPRCPRRRSRERGASATPGGTHQAQRWRRSRRRRASLNSSSTPALSR